MATKLEANGPAIAIVTQALRASDLLRQLERMAIAGPGVAGPDLRQRGTEIVCLADDLMLRLKDGL